jgi:hypothetical protein
MPLPKCSPKEVYNKKSKKCVEIGSDVYKAILKNNPDAFKHYAAKIAKATKAPPTCGPSQVYNKLTGKCVNIASQAYRAALKKDPTVFNNQKNKILAFFKPSSPNETLANIMKKETPLHLEKCNKPDEVYSKLTKRCVKIGGQAFKQALKKDPTVFDSQKQKIEKSKSVKKMNLVGPKTPPKPKTPEGLKKLLLKRQPVPKVSAKTQALLMKKVIKHLKTKTPNVPNNITNNIFVKKSTEMKLYYFDYFTNDIPMFKKIKTYKRKFLNVKISRDNVYKYFYKHVVKLEMNPDIIDTKWFVDMQKYIASLTHRERYALFSYTKHGDVYVNLMERGLPIDFNKVRMDPLVYEIVSTTTDAGFYDALTDTGVKIMANKKSISFEAMRKDKSGKLMGDFKNIIVYELGSRHFKEEYLRSMIKSLSTTLHSIFAKAPVTTKPMVVYRGVKDSFFTADDYNKPMKKDEVFVNKGFVSTSLLHTVPMEYFMSGSGCCFKVITILPGTKCIPLIGLTHFRGEIEFLLDKNTKYIIRDKYTALAPQKALNYYGNEIETKRIKVSDIIIG